MDQNNNIQSDSRIEGINNTGKPSKEYALPQTKEQFKQVLEQAQQGQYQQQYTEPSRQSDHNSREQYDTYEPNSAYEPRSTYEQPAEPKRESFSDYRKPVYVSRFTPAKVKKKFNPLVIIIPVILLLIAAAVVFFIFFNTLSYRKAEEKYFDGIYKSLLNHTASAEEKSKNLASVLLETNITSPLGSTADITDIDLSNIYLRLDTATQGSEIYNMLYIVSEGTNINAEGWIDREKKSALVLFPTISDIYAYFEVSDAAKAADPSEYVKAFGEVLSKTSKSYFELIGEPEIVKDQEFAINETVYTADKYVIRLDEIQTAKIEKALIDNLIENDKTAQMLCNRMGYENKEELLADEKIKEELDRLNTIIDGTQADYPAIDMTVYIKNNAIIGRDTVITFSEQSEDAETNSQAFFKLFEIPTDKGSLTHLYYKNGSNEITVTCDDESSKTDKNIHGGKLSVSYGDNTYTVNYSEFAVTDELFQGKALITSEKNPALTAAVDMKTENGQKQFTLSVPNVVAAIVTLTTPSDILFREMPALSEGEYADFSDYTHDKEYNRSDAEAAAVEKLNSDISGYILKLMGLDNTDGNGKDDTDNKTDPSDTENNTPDNPNNDDPDSALPPEDDPNVSESSETSVSETTAATDNENTTQNNLNSTTETSSTESPVTLPPESDRPQTTTTVPSAPTLDVGGSHKINNAQLDSFNSGNYYKAEIYIDGASNADSSVYISEISGSFDSYIKGKALQIDFAEGYSFDSALVVLTIPSNTVTSGRNYPNSDILRGLNRYRIMGMKNSDSYESEISFYKYSGNQIGFIAEGSGYYYLIDMDEYYHSVFGISPDDMTVQYAE